MKIGSKFSLLYIKFLSFSLPSLKEYDPELFFLFCPYYYNACIFFIIVYDISCADFGNSGNATNSFASKTQEWQANCLKSLNGIY